MVTILESKNSPYKALFGVEARVGLRSTALPEEVLKTMVTEDDLLGVYTLPLDTAHPEDSPECSTHPEDSPECSAHPEVSPEGSPHPEDSPEDFAHPENSPEYSSNPEDSPECSGHPGILNQS